MKEVYIKSKEELIAWVKSVGEEIAENAEEFVNQFFPEDAFETGQCCCKMEEK